MKESKVKKILDSYSRAGKAVDNTPYVIAEIGANHNGDMKLAKSMILSAKKCGADAVKFQSWTPSSVVSKIEFENNQKYDDSPKKHFGSLKEMVQKYYLRPEQHFELKEYCDSLDIEFNSTPFSNSEVDLLLEVGISYFKIASMDITNLELLSYVSSKNKPIILSTGMASIEEIATAVSTINQSGNSDIILLHCISIYPPNYNDINLRNITMLRDVFNCPVGFSDHSIGSSIPLAAIALGACIIEKHFTTDKNLPGWDHEISADPEELLVICEESKNIYHSLGSYSRVVSNDENLKRLKFRRSVVANRDLFRGEKISDGDISLKRPGTGIPSDCFKYVLGRTLKNNVSSDILLKWDDFV